MRAFLLFPAGPTSLSFNGRLLDARGGAPFSLLGVQQEHQHACVCPPDGSLIVFDVAVIDHRGGRVALVTDVEKTGGTLATLSSPPLRFEPSTGHVGAGAQRLARMLFPEVVEADDALEDAVVVEGAATFVGDLEWRRRDGGGEGAAAATADTAAAAVTAAVDGPARCIGDGGGDDGFPAGTVEDGDAILRRLAGRRVRWQHASNDDDDAEGARGHGHEGSAVAAGAASADGGTDVDADGWTNSRRQQARVVDGGSGGGVLPSG